jgi:WD40 repeat protein
VSSFLFLFFSFFPFFSFRYDVRQVEDGRALHVRNFEGRRNATTFAKEVDFLGDGEFVVTGGDNGHLYVWHTDTGKVKKGEKRMRSNSKDREN